MHSMVRCYQLLSSLQKLRCTVRQFDDMYQTILLKFKSKWSSAQNLCAILVTQAEVGIESN